MQLIAQEKRIGMIDIARFYAMAFVFFGHFIERLMILENTAATLQYRFIYSFHMVLFVVLAGYVARDGDLEASFGKFIKARVLSRLLPFVFFTAIFMVLPVFVPGDLFSLKLPSVEGYLTGLTLTAFGLPLFCVPSWFVLMIFSVELIHFLCFRFLRSSNAKILLAALLFYVAGYFLNLHFDIFNPNKGRVVGWNYLFVHEAIIMYAFYLLGALLRRNPCWMENLSVRVALPAAIVTILIVIVTFELNAGPFNFDYHNAVVIMFSSHGSLLWFPITAVAGSLFVLFLARCTAPFCILVWMGRNTLILIFMNGVFYHFINPPLAKWVLSTLPPSFVGVLLVGCVVTVASLLLCVPFIHVLNRYVPQLVGKPKLNGPLLKNLI